MIQGLHHISMKTKNDTQYAKAKSFYTEVIGLGIIMECDNCLLLDTGNGVVEIFKNGDCDLEQGVIRHLALATDDVDACADKVEKAGYEVFVQPKNVLVGGVETFPARIAFCKGPLGEEIEFFCQGW